MTPQMTAWLIMRKEKKEKRQEKWLLLKITFIPDDLQSRSQETNYMRMEYNFFVRTLCVKHNKRSQSCCVDISRKHLSPSNTEESDLCVILRGFGSWLEQTSCWARALEALKHLWERGVQEIKIFQGTRHCMLWHSNYGFKIATNGRKTVLTYRINFRADEFSGFCENIKINCLAFCLLNPWNNFVLYDVH